MGHSQRSIVAFTEVNHVIQTGESCQIQRVRVREKDHVGYIAERAAPLRFGLHGRLRLLSPGAGARRGPTPSELLPSLLCVSSSRYCFHPDGARGGARAEGERVRESG